MPKTRKYFCEDCGTYQVRHISTWLNEIIRPIAFLPPLPQKIESACNVLFEKVFTFLRFAEWQTNFSRSDIHLRTFCFIEEARKRGVACDVMRTPFGYTNNVRAKVNGKTFYFESLPTAHAGGLENLVADKIKTKEFLVKNSFPVLRGKAFFFWQKKKALNFARKEIGFPNIPIVVKPRNGSLSRHVTTNICDDASFVRAIKKSIAHSPSFMVEEYMPNAHVYRATVIDFDAVFCVEKSSAKIIGDGVSTIASLIKEKNKNPERGPRGKRGYAVHEIVADNTVKEALHRQNYSLESIPKKGSVINVQNDPFIRLGGDLDEVTPFVHPDNKALFKNVAKLFNIKIVGLDFLAQDISISWKEQRCAILELNNMPHIGIHQFPSSGLPQNVAGAVADLFFKYYVNN